MLSHIGRDDGLILCVPPKRPDDIFRAELPLPLPRMPLPEALDPPPPIRMLFLRELPEKVLKDLLHISLEGETGAHILPDLRLVDVNVDDRSVLRIFRDISGGPIGEADAGREQEIALGLRLGGREISMHAAHAEIIAVGVRHRASPHHA